MTRRRLSTAAFSTAVWVVSMAILSPMSIAQSNPNSAYYCVGDTAGAILLKTVEPPIVVAPPRLMPNFVVRLNLVNSYVRKKKNEFDQDEPMKVYEVTITPQGGNFERQCVSSSGNEVLVHGFLETVKCDAYFPFYKINLNLNLNRRFMAYSVGYAAVAGDDGKTHREQPSFEGGACTKIQ
jgi:hypothetical protein